MPDSVAGLRQARCTSCPAFWLKPRRLMTAYKVPRVACGRTQTGLISHLHCPSFVSHLGAPYAVGAQEGSAQQYAQETQKCRIVNTSRDKT